MLLLLKAAICMPFFAIFNYQPDMFLYPVRLFGYKFNFEFIACAIFTFDHVTEGPPIDGAVFNAMNARRSLALYRGKRQVVNRFDDAKWRTTAGNPYPPRNQATLGPNHPREVRRTSLSVEWLFRGAGGRD